MRARSITTAVHPGRKIRAVGTTKMKSGLSEGGAVTCSSLSVCSEVNSTLGEATFWATCSARLAPISTDETPGRCATQAAARIVNVSSGSGSLTMNAEPTNPHRAMFGVVYSPSKTALNAITLAFALELESTRIKVNAADPDFTATDLNNNQGTGTVEEAACEPVRLALLGPDGPTGAFSNTNGPVPW